MTEEVENKVMGWLLTSKPVPVLILGLLGVLIELPLARAQEAPPFSPNGVRTLSPEGAIEPTGTWNLGTRAGDFVYIAGMRGIDPQTNTLVPEPEDRIRQAFMNMQLIGDVLTTLTAWRYSEGFSSRYGIRILIWLNLTLALFLLDGV